MEIIDFINDLRTMGSAYYKAWLPLILQFHKEENVSVKLSIPFDVSKSNYYRIINYGLMVFPNYVKNYTLTKNRCEIVLSPKEIITPKNDSFIETEKSKPLEVEPINSEPIEAEVITEKPKVPRKKSNETSYQNEVYEEIIEFLNLCTGKNYKNSSIMNRKFITQRLNDGFTIDDFKKVISVKSTNWLGGQMEQFLRPETLFSNKFESYLNENVISNIPNSNLKNSYDQISIATQIINNQG
jgi:uncharacterized phage protein (TIGR02220 family)